MRSGIAPIYSSNYCKHTESVYILGTVLPKSIWFVLKEGEEASGISKGGREIRALSGGGEGRMRMVRHVTI